MSVRIKLEALRKPRNLSFQKVVSEVKYSKMDRINILLGFLPVGGQNDRNSQKNDIFFLFQRSKLEAIYRFNLIKGMQFY